MSIIYRSAINNTNLKTHNIYGGDNTIKTDKYIWSNGLNNKIIQKIAKQIEGIYIDNQHKNKIQLKFIAMFNKYSKDSLLPSANLIETLTYELSHLDEVNSKIIQLCTINVPCINRLCTTVGPSMHRQ